MTDSREKKIRKAIWLVRRALAKDFIVKGCETHPTIGCVSCEMVSLDRQLKALEHEYQKGGLSVDEQP